MKVMKPNTTLFDQVIEGLERRSAETAPYVPRPVVRWNAKVIEFPVHKWPLERQWAIAEQAVGLALKAQQKLSSKE
jgi:hypothetical protein